MSIKQKTGLNSKLKQGLELLTSKTMKVFGSTQNKKIRKKMQKLCLI